MTTLSPILPQPQAISGGAAAAVSVSTATGWMALLQEDDVVLREVALRKLLVVVDTLWHEVAEVLPDLEAMAEGDGDDNSNTVRQLSAALASRVFFHLEEPVQALKLALEAGPEYFDMRLADTSPYVERLVSCSVDAYIAARQKQVDDEAGDAEDTVADRTAAAAAKTKEPKGDKDEEDDAASLPMDQLQAMVHRLVTNCCESGHYQEALGVALEAREVSKLKDIFEAAHQDLPLLSYALRSIASTVSSKAFRLQALSVVAESLEKNLDQSSLKKNTATSEACYDLVLVHQLLGNAETVAVVLAKLIQGTPDQALTALQLCFDIQTSSGNEAFVKKVALALQQQYENTAPRDTTAVAAAAADVDTSDDDAMDPESTTVKKRFEQADRVLVGGFFSELALSFLHKRSNADRLIMEQLKKTLEERSSGSSRSSVLHNAAVMAHSYLFAGTTNDSFLRDYLDWMKKASNWAKFSATASLGVVHARHVTEAMHLLEPYLPADPSSSGADNNAAAAVSSAGGYAEGGSLYALGLIQGTQQAGSSSAKRAEATNLLRSHLRVSHANEVISHGACLAVGLVAMSSADLQIVHELKEVLDTDSAVAGEAAGMAIGMVLAGTGAGNSVAGPALTGDRQEECLELVAELKNYARETAHEKIIRGIAMGMAIMNFGQEERADATIQEMLHDRDPVMRYGAQYCIALAYCGTGSNKAVRLLLHAAVSDVSDDVRMAAVLGLAFVLFKTPERVPELVNLLLESFNPHVRYAACMAVGIAMAGTGDTDAVAMLEPMLDDMTDYVRQGALQGTAMIYMMCSDSTNGRKVRLFREKLSTIVSEKHQSTLTKMGAIISMGILDSAGRNASLQLSSSENLFTHQTAAIGLALWLQHWHWYPMMHMWSLAITPTFTVGLNKDLKFPKNWKTVCHSKPSVYAYPRKLEEKKEEKKKRVETVTLSTTAKEKARLARKKAKESGNMDVDGAEDKDSKETKESEEEQKPEGDDAMDVDKETTSDSKEEEDGEENKKVAKKKKEPEPTSFEIPNPARITKAQSAVTEFELSQRYHPVRPAQPVSGVIILTDTTPEQEEEDLGAVKSPSLEPEGELAPPEPFEWTPPPLPPPKEEEDGDKAKDDTEKKEDKDSAMDTSQDKDADKQ